MTHLKPRHKIIEFDFECSDMFKSEIDFLVEKIEEINSEYLSIISDIDSSKSNEASSEFDTNSETLQEVIEQYKNDMTNLAGDIS
jgi:gas vesicle protein